MNRIYINRALIAIIFVTLFTVFAIPQNSNLNCSTENRRIDLSVHQKNFQEILVELSRKHRFPIGWQVASDDEMPVCKHPVDVQLRNVDINQIMTKVISICPSYSWEFVDGVVNVYPAVKENTILDTKIEIVQVGNKTSVEILDAIFELPDIKAQMTSTETTRDTTMPFWNSDSNTASRFSVELTNTNVRRLLNYLVTNTNQRAWIYYKVKDSQNRFALRFF